MSEYACFSNEANKCIDKQKCIKIINSLRNQIFNNYDCSCGNDLNINEINKLLEEEINNAYCMYGVEKDTKYIINVFNDKLKEVCDFIKEDVSFFYESDPACLDINEIILAYPGLYAIMVYRISNILYKLDVPYIPRILSEYAHSITGIDIHPGASIGKRFFIDHGTGIVIGETTIIGENVKMYQGVTLGAISLRDGSKLKGKRRHPIIEDNVTIYSNACILGQDTIIGKNSVIGCNAFIIESVKANTIVK